MPDSQTIVAIASGMAAVIVAVTGLLTELRRWRRGKADAPSDPPGNSG